MLKKILLSCVIFALSTMAIADASQDDCESAVDAADRLGSDRNSHCDYTKTGLNGLLHKAFSGNGDAANTGNLSSTSAASAAKNTLSRTLPSAEFDSAQQLMTLRYNLIQLAAQQCVKGFVVESERYLPAAGQHLTLEFNYHCL